MGFLLNYLNDQNSSGKVEQKRPSCSSSSTVSIFKGKCKLNDLRQLLYLYVRCTSERLDVIYLHYDSV